MFSIASNRVEVPSILRPNTEGDGVDWRQARTIGGIEVYRPEVDPHWAGVNTYPPGTRMGKIGRPDDHEYPMSLAQPIEVCALCRTFPNTGAGGQLFAIFRYFSIFRSFRQFFSNSFLLVYLTCVLVPCVPPVQRLLLEALGSLVTAPQFSGNFSQLDLMLPPTSPPLPPPCQTLRSACTFPNKVCPAAEYAGQGFASFRGVGGGGALWFLCSSALLRCGARPGRAQALAQKARSGVGDDSHPWPAGSRVSL